MKGNIQTGEMVTKKFNRHHKGCNFFERIVIGKIIVVIKGEQSLFRANCSGEETKKRDYT